MQQIMKYIYEIYNQGSFTAAAAKLFVSQPALSASVKRYEEQLGIRLFDRSCNPVALTDAGRIYIRGVEKLMAVEDDMFEQLHDLSQMKTGTLRVGGANFISSYLMPRIIMTFSRCHPGIHVALTEANSSELQAQLQNEQLDIVIDYQFDPKQFTACPLLSENILLCAPIECAEKLPCLPLGQTAAQVSKDGVEGMTPVALSLFSREKFIILKQGNDMHSRAYQLCMEQSFVPDTVIELDQLMTSYSACLSGMGCTFVSDTLVTAAAKDGPCLFFRLPSPKARRTLFLATRKNHYISRAAEAFIVCAKEMYQEPSPPRGRGTACGG